MSVPTSPSCHLSHVSGPGRHGHTAQTAVWICEHPYRTMRLKGPSSDCADCPVWQEMQRARANYEAADEISTLEAMM